MTNLSTSLVARLENVSKKYVLRRHGMNPVKRMAHRVIRGRRPEDVHWALRNITAEIRAGETVALMGVNGGGKSTLLRTLMGVTNPTEGSVRVKGRLGGVVDLGAGFHGDLTGFENIFLHGTLLGLSRADIRARLRSIEDFCELGRFLNSPVKHYSMGMFLRLGFAIAVHSEPDIFIIDEALAVGDGYFQWKCLRKLEEFRREGRTLLFVSHLPEISETLCERALWLHDGCLKADGPSSEVAAAYHTFVFEDLLKGSPPHAFHELTALLPYSRFGTGEVVLKNVRFLDSTGLRRRSFSSDGDISVQFTAVANRPMEAGLYVVLERPGQTVTYVTSTERGRMYRLQEGENELEIKVPTRPLHEGVHYFTLAITDLQFPPTIFDCHRKLYSFSIRDRGLQEQEFAQGFVRLRPEISFGPGGRL